MCLTLGSVASAVEYGGLGGIPANPDPNNPRTKSIFIYTLSPGQGRQDAVNVVNNTGEAKVVEVYATDSEVASGGSFACRQKVDTPVAVGSWIRLAQMEVTLPPSANKIVPFDVTVPGTVSVGEHNGCIVIQEKAADPQQAGNGVQLSFRSAIRVAITIPGDIVKDVEFTDLTIKPDAKKYIINAKLTNKGNVSLDTDVQVAVTGLFNRHVYRNGGVYPLLAQKTPAEFNFEFPRPFWGGIFRVSGNAHYNGDVDAALGSADPKNVRKDSPSRWLFVAPQPRALVLELLLLLVTLALIWLAVKRTLGHRKLAESWQPYTVKKGDTVVGLAEKRHTGWKTIAKVNKLRAPYALTPGTKIKLPAKPKDA